MPKKFNVTYRLSLLILFFIFIPMPLDSQTDSPSTLDQARRALDQAEEAITQAGQSIANAVLESDQAQHAYEGALVERERAIENLNGLPTTATASVIGKARERLTEAEERVSRTNSARFDAITNIEQARVDLTHKKAELENLRRRLQNEVNQRRDEALKNFREAQEEANRALNELFEAGDGNFPIEEEAPDEWDAFRRAILRYRETYDQWRKAENEMLKMWLFLREREPQPPETEERGPEEGRVPEYEYSSSLETERGTPFIVGSTSKGYTPPFSSALVVVSIDKTTNRPRGIEFKTKPGKNMSFDELYVESSLHSPSFDRGAILYQIRKFFKSDDRIGLVEEGEKVNFFISPKDLHPVHKLLKAPLSKKALLCPQGTLLKECIDDEARGKK